MISGGLSALKKLAKHLKLLKGACFTGDTKVLTEEGYKEIKEIEEGERLLMTLFEECLEALKENNNIIEISETDKLFNKLKKEFPMTSYGRIDWSKSIALNQGIYSCNYFEQILDYIKDKKQNVIILWDESTLSAIESTLETVFNVIDDVTAVAFNTWIYLRKSKKVIEFYHDGIVTVGITTIR